MTLEVAWIFCAVLAVSVVGLVIVARRGDVIGWWKRLREVRQRILAEDALKYLHECGWDGHTATTESLAESLNLALRRTFKLIARMEARGWLRSSGDGLRLTGSGGQLALEVIRAHRLWERYLVDEARMPLVDVHSEAERREHDLSPEALDAFEEAMGFPSRDPHGDPIPTSGGDLARLSAKPIADFPIDSPARIVHLEDEPASVFAQIDALGFHLGQTIRVLDVDARRVVLLDGEKTHVLAPLVAANIFVAPAAKELEPDTAFRLSALRPGQRATIRKLDEALQGFTRRRLLDFGLTPGTDVTVEMSSMGGDPMAYRVRDSLIALRSDQARHVLVDVKADGGSSDA